MTPLHFTGPAATAVWSLLHDERCALGSVVTHAELPAHGGLTVYPPPYHLSSGEQALWDALTALAFLAPLAHAVDAPNRAAFAETVTELLGVKAVAA